MAQTNQKQAPEIYEPACQVNPPSAPPIGYPQAHYVAPPPIGYPTMDAPPIGYPQGHYVAPPPIGHPTMDDSGYPSQHTPETKMTGSFWS